MRRKMFLYLMMMMELWFINRYDSVLLEMISTLTNARDFASAVLFRGANF